MLFNIINAIANDRYINLLDTNDIWEEKIQFLCKANSSVKLDIIQNDNTVKLYKLTISYLDNQKLSNIFYPQEYFLRIFKQANTDNFKITPSPMYNSKYSKYLYVAINNQEYQEGMLPVINTDNLPKIYQLNVTDNTLSDTLIITLLSGFLETAEHVSRQTHVQSQLDHKNILKTFTIHNITFLEIPDDTLLNYIFYKTAMHKVEKIRDIIQDIENAVNYLHNNNIVHGDITLANIFIKNDTIMLSGFENAKTANSVNANIPKDSFYAMHLPKYYSPKEFNISKMLNPIRDVTVSDDKYYLGMVFAVILYHTFSSKYFLCIDDLVAIQRFRLSTDMFINLSEKQKLKSATFYRLPNKKDLRDFAISSAFLSFNKINDDSTNNIYIIIKELIHKINILQAHFLMII
jgi:serine/threonine protein kinase